VRNPKQPCREPRPSFVAISITEYSQKNVLSKVLGGCPVMQQVKEKPHHPILVTRYQLLKRLMIPPDDSQHQLHIRVRKVLVIE
jgi:hypothetical protein